MTKPNRAKPKAKKRIKPAADLSYAIFEMAAQSVGVSMFDWYPTARRVRIAKKIIQLRGNRK